MLVLLALAMNTMSLAPAMDMTTNQGSLTPAMAVVLLAMSPGLATLIE